MRRLLGLGSPTRPAFVAAVTLLVVACNGGGHSKKAIRVGALGGTASDGSPIASATVTARDWTGASASTTTDANGRYLLDVRTLRAPYMVEVDDGATRFFGFAFHPGTLNLTFFSDQVATRLSYAFEANPDSVFADPPSYPEPSRQAFDLVKVALRDTVAPWLVKVGLDPLAFDLLETPFTISHSGFNELLHWLIPGGDSFSIDDGTSRQDVTFTRYALDRILLDSVMTTAQGSTGTRNETWFPMDSTNPLAGSVVGVQGALDALRATVNRRGAALTADDLLPAIAVDCLDDGKDQATLAGMLASMLRGVALDDLRLTRILDWGDSGRSVTVEFELALRVQGHSLREHARETFFQAAGGEPFLIVGNQHHGDVYVGCEHVRFADPFGTQTFDSVNVDVYAPTALFADVSITSDDVPATFASDKVPLVGLSTDLYWPTPSTSQQFTRDYFNTYTHPLAYPPVGTNFDVTLSPVLGLLAETIRVTGRGFTTEPIALLAPTGHALADAALGGRLTVSWQLPESFVAHKIALTGEVWNGSGNQRAALESDAPIAATDTVAHLSFPANLLGQTIAGAALRLAIEGRNGEITVVNWQFFDD